LRARKGLVIFPEDSRWRLREYLLRSPQLAGSAAASSAGARAGATSLWDENREISLDRVRCAIRGSIAAATGRAPDELRDLENLADLGLDSLSILHVLAGIQQNLRCRIDGWERIGSRLSEVRVLEQVVLAAVRSAGIPAAAVGGR
jgi:aryl carrier-like protein